MKRFAFLAGLALPFAAVQAQTQDNAAATTYRTLAPQVSGAASAAPGSTGAAPACAQYDPASAEYAACAGGYMAGGGAPPDLAAGLQRGVAFQNAITAAGCADLPPEARPACVLSVAQGMLK